MKKLADVLFEQGLQQMRARAHEFALQNLQDALDIYHQIDDYQGEGWTIFWLGIVYFDCVDYEKAFDCYQQTLAIARGPKKSDKVGQSWTKCPAFLLVF